MSLNNFTVSELLHHVRNHPFAEKSPLIWALATALSDTQDVLDRTESLTQGDLTMECPCCAARLRIVQAPGDGDTHSLEVQT